MLDIKSLYNVLFQNPSSLSKDEIMILFSDFSKRQTGKITAGNAGVYKIMRTCKEYIFNGFLVFIPDKKIICDFQILMDEEKEIKTTNEAEVLLVNCDFKKVETPQQKIPTTEIMRSKPDIESTIDKIERISRLHDSGAITDEEFEELKGSILNNKE